MWGWMYQSLESGTAASVVLAQAGAGPNPLISMLPTLVMIAIGFYFLMVLPERQRQKEMKKLLDALKKDDRVLTSAGIYGIVANINRESGRVTLKIDESSGAKMQVSLTSVERILTDETPSSGA